MRARVIKIEQGINGRLIGTGDELALFVEPIGRNWRGVFLDPRGLVANVTLNGRILTKWDQYGLKLENVAGTNEDPNPEIG